MEDILLMFSGGRDSFLSAIYAVEGGYRVNLVTYDNGCMSNIGSADIDAERLIHKYSHRVNYIGLRSNKKLSKLFMDKYMNTTIDESCSMFPRLLPYQLNCLSCHTSMVVESIKLCKEQGIKRLFTGARKSQGFIVDTPEMIQEYADLAISYDISFRNPVYNLESDWDRKLEITDRGFVPKTEEIQCWKGCPLDRFLSKDEIDSLVSYYRDVILPLAVWYLR